MEIKYQQPMVSIVSVNYDQPITCEMLASLRKVTYPNFEILVVDNASLINHQILLKKCILKFS
jgi:hypothetical protein